MQALDELAEFEPPRLSGSGGGVFAFDTLGAENAGEAERGRLAKDLDQTLNRSQMDAAGDAASGAARWRVWPFRTLNRSSLLQRASS